MRKTIQVRVPPSWLRMVGPFLLHPGGLHLHLPSSPPDGPFGCLQALLKLLVWGASEGLSQLSICL